MRPGVSGTESEGGFIEPGMLVVQMSVAGIRSDALVWRVTESTEAELVAVVGDLRAVVALLPKGGRLWAVGADWFWKRKEAKKGVGLQASGFGSEV
jgi:hypothetical protein